jgi:hypothetical protein
VATIGTSDLKRGAVTSSKIRNNTIRSTDVRNRTLRFRDFACPGGTRRFETACFETGVRQQATWENASIGCATVNRRLPTASELVAFRLQGGITLQSPELSSNVFRNGLTHYFMAVNENGSITQQPTTTQRFYRCVAPLRG